MNPFVATVLIFLTVYLIFVLLYMNRILLIWWAVTTLFNTAPRPPTLFFFPISFKLSYIEATRYSLKYFCSPRCQIEGISFLNEPVSAQADGCTTCRIYHCSFHTGVPVLNII